MDSEKEAAVARWRRPKVADANAGPPPPVAASGPAGTSNLFERDAQLAEAPKCSDIRRWHGVIGAVWHELTEPSALKTAFESCLPGDMPSLGRRPSSPGIGSSWLTQQSRPWRADALPPILALGTLLKERDGLLWGGWTERTFVLMQNGQLLYYLRTPDSNDEVLGDLANPSPDPDPNPNPNPNSNPDPDPNPDPNPDQVLGDLRGVIELDAAVIEERPLDEEEAAELPECSPSFLLISTAEEPEAQPFYEWPKRCATLACRGETAAQQAQWLGKLRGAIEALRIHRSKAPASAASAAASALRRRRHTPPPGTP